MYRNITLEKRIEHLEKLLSRKNENMWDYVDMGKIRKSRKHSSSLENDLRDVFDNRFCGEDYYDSDEEFKENMYSMASGHNDAMVDSAIEWLADDFDYDKLELEDRRNDIKRKLSHMAGDFIEDWGDTWNDDYDDDEEDYEDDETDEEREQREADIRGLAAWAKRQRQLRGLESVKQNRQDRNITLERRISLLERLVNNRKTVKNEDAMMLPTGMQANDVGTVLSQWAGTEYYDKDGALDALEEEGVIYDKMSKWYSSIAEVRAAIAQCWEDQIGGAARFFAGDFGGATKCQLTLYPISGGESRARNLVLKFDW